MPRIYKTPFASVGDKEPLASAEQPDGKVSLPDGWTADYSRGKLDPGYRPVGRLEMNGILYEITDALAEIQQYGFATWQSITGGWPENARVVKDGTIYISTTCANSTEPGTPGATWEIDVSVSPGGTATEIQYRIDEETLGGVPGTEVSGRKIKINPTGEDTGVEISPVSNTNDGARVIISPGASANAEQAGQVIISPTGLGIGSGRVEINPQNDLILKQNTWPSNLGVEDQVLTADGTGRMSWKYQGGSGANPGGDTGSFQYNDNGIFAGADSLMISNDKITMNPLSGVDITPEGPVSIATSDENQDIGISTFESDINISAGGLGGNVSITTQEGSVSITPSGPLDLSTDTLNGDISVSAELGDIEITALSGDINISKTSPTSGVFINGLEYPDSDGTPGQVIATDSSGKLSFVDNTAGSNIFETIEVPGQSDIVAAGPDDTLHFNAGNNISLSTNSGSKTLTIGATASGGNGTIQWNSGGVLSGASGITTNGLSLTVAGTVSVAGESNFGNLSLSGNTISATNPGGDVILSPDGSGRVIIDGLYYPENDGVSGQVMTTNGSGEISWQQAGGVPGGLNTQIQYNNNGTFGGVTGATFVGGTITLSPTQIVMSPSQSITMSPAQSINLTPDQDIDLSPTSGDLKLRGNVWPVGLGTPGQVLSTDGAGDLSWADAGGGGSTPGGSGSQLQYRVDANTFGGVSGTSFSSNNLTISPTGNVIIKGSRWPTGTGSSGQVLTTNGSGILSWGSGGGGAGRVLNVYQAVKTNTWSSTSTSPAEITGLRVTGIIPVSINSKFIILCHMTYAGTNSPYAGFSISRQIASGSTTYPYLGDTAGIRLRVSTTGFGYNIPSLSASMNFMDSPGTTQPVSYWISGNTSSGTLYINRAGSSDSDAVAAYRGSSSIIILEIGS